MVCSDEIRGLGLGLFKWRGLTEDLISLDRCFSVAELESSLIGMVVLNMPWPSLDMWPRPRFMVIKPKYLINKT